MDQGSTFQPLTDGGNRKVNILLSVTGCTTAEAILPAIAANDQRNIRFLGDQGQCYGGPGATGLHRRQEAYSEKPISNWRDGYIQARQWAHQHASWADVLVLVADADTISAMLAGLGYNTTLAILRCWDVSKKIIMLPEMSMDQWRNPMTRRQSIEIHNKWPWIHVLAPVLWETKIKGGDVIHQEMDLDWIWEGPQEAAKAICDEVAKISSSNYRVPCRSFEHTKTIGNKICPAKDPCRPRRKGACPTSKLPLEIWTIIFEFSGDWEYAAALGIYTTIPTPCEWQPHIAQSPARPKSLEYTLLTASFAAIYKALDSHSSTPSALSPLAVKIIFKFSLTPVLSHLATHQKDIFWTSFGLPQIPHQASTIYNNPTILEWWLTEPAILRKEYGPEALDGASRAGFVDVLEWWIQSGLEVRYTEKALENASAKGHTDVLEWWKKTSGSRQSSSSSTITSIGGSIDNNDNNSDTNNINNTKPFLPLKVGKSILSAAQSGRAGAIRWWHDSGIPYPHEEGVARLASTHGHVNVLELWRELKGNKMICDNQVLVGPTKNGHADVLEWWKSRSGMRVEYKTCDIEEAMEDSLGGCGEREVRRWWEGNGLNLGVGTSEWMKVKTLGG